MAGVKQSAKVAEVLKTENDFTEIKKADSGTENKDIEEIMTLAYIGPSLPAGQLKTNRILIGTMSEIRNELKGILEKYPLIEKMLVPVEKLAEKKDRAGTAGNILNKYYTDLVSSIAANEAAKEG